MNKDENRKDNDQERHPGAKLDAYVDGELTGDEWQAVDQHVHACESCRQEVAAIQLLQANLQETSVPDPGPAYWASFSDRVESRLESTPPLPEPSAYEKLISWFVPGNEVSWWRLTGAVGLASVLLFVGVRGFREVQPHMPVLPNAEAPSLPESAPEPQDDAEVPSDRLNASPPAVPEAPPPPPPPPPTRSQTTAPKPVEPAAGGASKEERRSDESGVTPEGQAVPEAISKSSKAPEISTEAKAMARITPRRAPAPAKATLDSLRHANGVQAVSPEQIETWLAQSVVPEPVGSSKSARLKSFAQTPRSPQLTEGEADRLPSLLEIDSHLWPQRQDAAYHEAMQRMALKLAAAPALDAEHRQLARRYYDWMVRQEIESEKWQQRLRLLPDD